MPPDPDHVRYVYFEGELQPKTRMIGIKFGFKFAARLDSDIDEVAIDRAGQIDWRQALPKEFWSVVDWKPQKIVDATHSILIEYSSNRGVLKRSYLQLHEAVDVYAGRAK